MIKLTYRFRERDKESFLIEEEEHDLIVKYEFLLNELYDLLGLAKLMSGNLECILYIRKNVLKNSKRKLKPVERNFLILEKIGQLLRELVNETEKISFDYVKPLKKESKAEEEAKHTNNIIIFPLDQNDDMYVYPDEILIKPFRDDDNDS